MLDAVLFDLDGTLADTVPSLLACVNHTLSAFGLPLRDESDVLSQIGKGERDFFLGFLPEGLIEKRGYTYCGNVIIESLRLAYELRIEN